MFSWFNKNYLKIFAALMGKKTENQIGNFYEVKFKVLSREQSFENEPKTEGPPVFDIK